MRRGFLINKEAKVKVFIKNETTNNFTDVRNISPRTDEFLSIIGPYISAIEHAARDLPFLVKGMDIKKRDNKMSKLLEYEDFLEVDFARFDMSISRDLLESFEHYILKSFFSMETDPLFYQALKMTLFTSAINWYSVGYRIEGTRCSGDAHTSIGNGLLNHFVTWCCLRKLPTDDWISYHEGDDGVIGLRGNITTQALYNMSMLDCLGLRAKVDTYHDINQVSFCGRFLTELRGKLVSYCDPYRTLTKFHTTVSMGDTKYLLAAKCNSYHHNDGHTPVIGALTFALLNILLPELHPQKWERYIKFSKRDLPWHYQFIPSLTALPKISDIKLNINPELRASFYIRTGMSPREQKHWEDYYLTFITHGIPDNIHKMYVEWTPFPDRKWIPWRSNEWIR